MDAHGRSPRGQSEQSKSDRECHPGCLERHGKFDASRYTCVFIWGLYSSPFIHDACLFGLLGRHATSERRLATHATGLPNFISTFSAETHGPRMPSFRPHRGFQHLTAQAQHRPPDCSSYVGLCAPLSGENKDARAIRARGVCAPVLPLWFTVLIVPQYVRLSRSQITADHDPQSPCYLCTRWTEIFAVLLRHPVDLGL